MGALTVPLVLWVSVEEGKVAEVTGAVPWYVVHEVVHRYVFPVPGPLRPRIFTKLGSGPVEVSPGPDPERLDG